MGSTRPSKHKNKSLSSGRPPNAQKTNPALTSAATRTLIRSHHRLHKELHKADAAGDDLRAKQLREQIESLGGLKSYQQASILGQAKDRGGDSSLVLMEWLKPLQATLRCRSPQLKMLEVGALSTTNACSKGHLFDMIRIDLNSQGPGILQQDFMERPLPAGDGDRFDIISLSLVLNYVPDARQRGEMLRRTRTFLRSSTESSDNASDSPFPALFLVLPLPCVQNSRYMNRQHLETIMQSLGYELFEHKQSSKLFYSLWRLTGDSARKSFAKTEINPGAKRNNFTIVLDCE